MDRAMTTATIESGFVAGLVEARRQAEAQRQARRTWELRKRLQLSDRIIVTTKFHEHSAA